MTKITLILAWLVVLSFLGLLFAKFVVYITFNFKEFLELSLFMGSMLIIALSISKLFYYYIVERND